MDGAGVKASSVKGLQNRLTVVEHCLIGGYEVSHSILSERDPGQVFHVSSDCKAVDVPVAVKKNSLSMRAEEMGI